MKKNLYDKLWDMHVVRDLSDGTSLLYVDRHLVHEVTSPQAFAGLRLAGRRVWRPSSVLAVPDHNVPTIRRDTEIADAASRLQLATLDENCRSFQVPFFSLQDPRQGIVHVIGPEQGATLPGMTVVCGDSHTSTHGAFGALAFGIGTSEVEHVLATQCLVTTKQRSMAVQISGICQPMVTAKDLILAIIGMVGTAGATGHVIEFMGESIQALSMEGRMTICNMAIEAGARAGLVAVDEKTIDYVQSRSQESPYRLSSSHLEHASAQWRMLQSDDGAHFDRSVSLDAGTVVPQVTWGTSPEMVVGVDGAVPDPAELSDAVQASDMRKALAYMGLKPGTAMQDIPIDCCFIGSCTNGRIEDLRLAANMVRGKKVAATVQYALVVPGSGLVKQQAEREGLDRIFKEAGFEWREPGCSMCLAMNADRLQAGQRCASTSNRNFEGRQGQGGRTHLVSPAMAAAAAVTGHFVDIRKEF